MKRIVFIGFACLSIYFFSQGHKNILVFTASYNNAKWYGKNLLSIFNQDYPKNKIRILYIDDASTDGTADLVEEFAKQHGWLDNLLLIRNKKRKYKMHNQYQNIHKYAFDHEIVIEFDGDDWLDNNHVFSLVDTKYKDNTVLLTYGNFWEWPSGAKHNRLGSIPKYAIQHQKIRTLPFSVWTPLRTYYAWLFKKIKKDDLMVDGEFIKTTSDVAIMYPMHEMAGEMHAMILDRVYVHNTATGINDHELNYAKQVGLEKYLRTLKPYNALSRKEVDEFFNNNELEAL